jgi:AcrR family transcriptional regulator
MQTRREVERDARVDWILDAALDLVVNEGVGALTTPRLAKALRYTPAAFYRYFDSKDALLLALETRTAFRYYDRFFSTFAAARARLPKLKPKPHALADLLLAVRVYCALAREEPKHFQLVTVLVSGDRSWMSGEATQDLAEKLMPRVAEIVGLFATAAEAGALDESSTPLHRAIGLWIALHGFLSVTPFAQTHPALLDVDGIIRDHVDSLFRGWGASPRDLHAAKDALDTVQFSRPI